MPDVMPWHKTQLVNPEYTRVDLVKEGANSKAHIKLFKSKGGTPMTLEEILKGLKPEHAAVVTAEMEELKKAAAKKNDGDPEDKIDGGADEATEDDVVKSITDPALKALVETQIAKTRAAEDEVRKVREKELETEAIAKAKEVPGVGAEETELADVYKKLTKVDAELRDQVFGIFKAASAVVGQSAAFTEVGKSATTEGGLAASSNETEAWNDIEKAATEIAKSGNITKQAAITKAIKQNPELYQRYLDAQQR